MATGFAYYSRARDITSAPTSFLRTARISPRRAPLPVPVLKREAGNFASQRLPP